MVYIVIHPNSQTLNSYIVKIINKYLDEKELSYSQIQQDSDLHIVQKGEKGNIKIEQIKELQKKLLYSPFNRNFQFGIIKNANFMTTEAQNALLKTLEETQDKTILILTVNSEDSVLQTILSRCTRVYPQEENCEIEICEPGTVENFLKEPIYEQIFKIDEIVKEKKTEEFLEELVKYFKEKHIKEIINGNRGQDEVEVLNILIKAKSRIRKNVNQKIALEYICFRINRMEDKCKKSQ